MSSRAAVAGAPIVLVPGFWLGAWAWDEVAGLLRANGHRVMALTLPGLESLDVDRSSITLADHVAVIRDAVIAAGEPVVLAVHSGAGAPGYAVTDRIPDRIATMVYVDSGPATGALDADFAAVELPLPSRDQLQGDENLDGLSEAQLETFRTRAIPEPGGALRDAADLTNDARLDVPTTVICTGFPSTQIKAAVEQGHAWIGGLAELRDVTYVDLPTSHWPMWSRPRDLADLLGDIAVASARQGAAEA
jgi:pimeloyl-ACP methyl ester carboxylesterase